MQTKRLGSEKKLMRKRMKTEWRRRMLGRRKMVEKQLDDEEMKKHSQEQKGKKLEIRRWEKKRKRWKRR